MKDIFDIINPPPKPQVRPGQRNYWPQTERRSKEPPAPALRGDPCGEWETWPGKTGQK